MVVMVIAVLGLTACSNSKKDIYKGMSAEQIYARAEENVAKENFSLAAKDFEALEARHPYGEYSDKAQLGQINAYYRYNEPALALSAADRFVRMNPRHPEVDYAYYMKGLITYHQNYPFTFRYLPLDRSARDASTIQESFDAFSDMLERFPNSQYAAEARERMVYLRELLAKHEMHVVDYYIRRGAYLSAANRGSYILKYYEHTSVIPRALASMVCSYRKLGMTQLADDALETLRLNYPDCSELADVL